MMMMMMLMIFVVDDAVMMILMLMMAAAFVTLHTHTRCLRCLHAVDPTVWIHAVDFATRYTPFTVTALGLYVAFVGRCTLRYALVL